MLSITDSWWGEEVKLSEVDFLVLDVETTGLDPESDKVVEYAVTRVRDSEFRGIIIADYINPGVPIPPEASAVHHITDEDVSDAPSWSVALEAIERASKGAIMVAHNAKFDSQFVDIDNPWLCTYRLARHLYPDLKMHTNQYLRYLFGLKFGVWERDVKGAAHGAFADSIVTSYLLIKMLGDYLEQGYADDDLALLELVDSPIEVNVMPFGKHKGVPMRDVPRSYMEWALGNMDALDNDLRWSMEKVLGQEERDC